MKRLFCITIDTEPDCDRHWLRSDPLTFSSVLEGIPQWLRPLWDRYDVRPVYFASPEVIENDACCELLKREVERGAEVGAHLHGEYIEPEKKYRDYAGTASEDYPCFAYDREIEKAKLKNLTDLIERKMGRRPVSYRAARYGADLETMGVLRELGYRVDSSVTPGIDWSAQGGPDHSHGPNQPYRICAGNYYQAGESNLLEVPITILGKRFWPLPEKWLFYRWLRPSHMTVFEMKRMIHTMLRRYRDPVLNLMFHSMEIMPGKSPFVQTRLGQRMFLARLERVLASGQRNGFVFGTLKEVYDDRT